MRSDCVCFFLFFFFFSSRRRHTRFLNVTGDQTVLFRSDRKSTRLNSSHIQKSRMPSSACKKKKEKCILAAGVHLPGRREPLLLWNERASGIDELFFFFNDTATTEICTYRHTLSLHDALPI